MLGSSVDRSAGAPALWISAISGTFAVIVAATEMAGMSAFHLSLSMVVVLTLLLASGSILHRTIIHPYVFFLLTASLFLGGRFFAHIVGGPSEIFYDDAFTLIDLSPEESRRLVATVLAALLAINSGYYAFYGLSGRGTSLSAAPLPAEWQKTLRIPAAALIVSCGVLAFIGAQLQLSVCKEAGYVGMYARSAELRWISAAQYGLLLGFGLAVVSGSRLWQLLGLVAMAAYTSVTLAIGIRSGFLSFAMLSVWLGSVRLGRIPLTLAILFPIALFLMAVAAYHMSCRATVATQETEFVVETRFSQEPSASIQPNKEKETPRKQLNYPDYPYFAREAVIFAYVQGTSVLSIAVADSIDAYPWTAYFQSFIPGFNVAMRILGYDIPLSRLYFAQYMASVWMSERYAKGEGFGWSIVSDFLVFSDGQPIVFLALAAVFGALLAGLVIASQFSAIWLGALAVLLPKIVLLPRAGVYSIFPYLITFLVLVAAWRMIWRAVASWRAPAPAHARTE